MLMAVLLFVPMLPNISFAQLEEMPKDVSKDKALNAINNSKDFDVFFLGDDESINEFDYSFKKIEKLVNVKTSKKYKSVWISKENVDEYLKSENIEKLEQLLNDGYSIFYLDMEDLTAIKKAFTNAKFEEESKDSIFHPRIGFITKNQKGEYFTGHILSDKKYNDTQVINSALSETWNRRNDIKYTRKQKTEKTALSLLNKVKANSGDDFSIGSSWDQVFGWTKYDYTTDFGNYSEWKAAFYLTDSKDGNDYYAMAFDAAMDPEKNISYSGIPIADELNYYSDADSNGQDNQLRSYAPQSAPTSSTYSFSIGSPLSLSGASVGASWSVTKDDLNLNDNSSPYYEQMNISFKYDHGGSGYDTQTSWQNASFIYQAPSGSNSVILDNKRVFVFKSTNLSGINGTDSGSDYFTTTVYK